jgi:outer membrane murein-binding lipoprotein Lpp
MKDRASMSAEIYKIQADEQKTLADLESKRGQFVDSIKAAGMEADQWVFQQVNELTKQIETLRNNYDAARIANESNFIMKPLLDVLSLQRQADMQNLIQKYQTQYLNANPSEKIVAAAKIFGSDWSYIQSGVALNTS